MKNIFFEKLINFLNFHKFIPTPNFLSNILNFYKYSNPFFYETQTPTLLKLILFLKRFIFLFKIKLAQYGFLPLTSVFYIYPNRLRRFNLDNLLEILSEYNKRPQTTKLIKVIFFKFIDFFNATFFLGEYLKVFFLLFFLNSLLFFLKLLIFMYRFLYLIFLLISVIFLFLFVIIFLCFLLIHLNLEKLFC